MALRRVGRLIAPLLVVAVILAACGGDDDDGTASQTTAGDDAAEESGDGGAADEGEGDDGDDGSEVGDGCDIVTAEDGEAVLGEPVRQMEDGTVPQQVVASCIWEVSEESLKLLQFYVFDGEMFYGAQVYADQPGFEELDGLGDEAFIAGEQALDLQMVDDGRTITLNVSGFEDADAERVRQELLDLAEKVADEV